MKTKLTIAFATVAFCATGFEQLGKPLSQFSGNQIVYNPGYAGIYDWFSANWSVHNSWVGIKGSPQMISLNAHAPFKNQRHAWGAAFQNEKWGPLTANLMNANYSYKVQLNSGVLQLGLQAGVFARTTNWNSIQEVEDPEDPFIEKGRKSTAQFDASVGLYYLASQWYFGLSAMHLNHPKSGTIVINGEEWYSQIRSQFFMMAGYNLPVGRVLSFRPEVFLRYVHNTPFSLNAGIHAYLDNRYSIGVNFLTGQKGISFQAKAMITDQIRIGYSYDTFYGIVKPYQRGSHEISINYLMRRSARMVDLLWL
jgi:type IX secretion system PorP/SprF family membrane protein